MTGANPLTFGVLISGMNALPTNPNNPCFNLDSGVTSVLLDGLRCVGGGIVRHGSRALDGSGANTFAWGPPAGPLGGLVAQTGAASGAFRYGQVFYREDDTQQCGTGQNTSNGIIVQIVP